MNLMYQLKALPQYRGLDDKGETKKGREKDKGKPKNVTHFEQFNF